jgi:hypothetical protein
MIKEYYAVARYLARVEEGEDATEKIYQRLTDDIKRLIMFDRTSEIKEMFTIAEGQEVSEEDFNNE